MRKKVHVGPLRTSILVAALAGAVACGPEENGPPLSARSTDPRETCVGAAAPARAQDAGPAEEITVFPCRIEIAASGVTLASSLVGTAPDPTWPILRRRDGSFVTAVAEAGSFAVWDSGGTLVRKVSREGQGPGELRGRPTLMVDAWDSIHVRDEDMRWSTFSPQLEYVRSADGWLLVHPRHVAFLGNGAVVSAFNPAATDGTLFRVLDRETGKELRSFGAAGPEEERPRRIVAPASDTTFWAMPQHRLELQEWTVTGALIQTYKPATSWMEREDDDVWAGAGTPLPVLTSLTFDAEKGLLWVRGMVPDPRTLEHSRELDMDEVSGLYDFVIQVIDAPSGRTVAMRREPQLDRSVSDFLGAGFAFRETEGRFGLKRYDILRMWLVPSS